MAEKRSSSMMIPTLIMAILAALALLFGYFAGQGQHIKDLTISLKMTAEILPLLFFAFILAGMVQVLLPQAQVSRWIGSESGIRGLLVGTFVGGILPGGPYVSLPLAAGLFRVEPGPGQWWPL